MKGAATVPELRAARLAAAALLASTLLGCGGQRADAQRMRSMTSARQLQNERRATVEVKYGAGRLRVAPARNDNLYQMELRYDDEQFRPVTDYDRAAGRLTLGWRAASAAATAARAADTATSSTPPSSSPRASSSRWS